MIQKSQFFMNVFLTVHSRGYSFFVGPLVGLLISLTSGMNAAQAQPSEPSVPRLNVILINADDLGFGDLGCYGSELIETPRLDQLAREGMRFRNFYAGATVCAPSRCTLFTGLHNGHAWVRGNAGGDMSIQSLRPDDVTLAELLQDSGYRTALCGKWGLGDDAPGAREGLPRAQGFDFFYGYLNQVHAHNYYPEFLWRNETQEPLRNVVVSVGGRAAGFVGGYATERIDYAHDLIMEEAITWVKSVHDQPFLLVLTPTIPHANNEGSRGTGDGQEVPDYGIYADRDWPGPDKGMAAMVTRLDTGIGELVDLLHELGIAERTVVLFTSDNGPHREGGVTRGKFNSSGPLRGVKRDLYEGGIRVPLIAWCPGTVPADSVTDQVGYQGDFLATLAEIAGEPMPQGTDSISLWPTLTGSSQAQQQHRYLYWEFYEQGGRQAVRFGKWKAIRQPMLTGPIQLFDLEADLGEASDLAAQFPEIVAQAEEFLREAHEPNPNWHPAGNPPQAPEPGDGRPRF